MNDFIGNALAALFDKFKAKNPKIAAVLIIVLIMLIAGLENGLAGMVGLGHLAEVILKWASMILLGLQGSRTTAILYGKNELRPEGS